MSATRPGSASAGFKRVRLLDRRGERPRPGELDLDQPRIPVEDLLHRVQVGGEQRPGPAHVTPWALGDPPAPRPGELDGQVDEQRGRPPGDIRPGPTARKLG